MSVVEAERGILPAALPVDLGWHNVVFALRTCLAAIAALAVAYWFELTDPQWATLTVFLLAQPTVGAAVAKGMWRTVGTVCGGFIGLVLVALFSQAPELLAGAMSLMVGILFYTGARLRNYAAYGVLLASYTMLLVGYDGSLDPLNAWTIAADRVAEILIGIAAVTTASVLIMPRYAGDVLRESLARTFSGLARYAATALTPGTPIATFVALRRKMVGEVLQFDALRSYTVFESPEMHADDGALRRTIREFLRVLAIARGLYFRLDDFGDASAGAVLARLRPALDAVAARLACIAGDPAAFAEPDRIRHELMDARRGLDEAGADLEAMVGRAPFDQLANALLVVHRAGDMLHALSMVAVAEAASVRAGPSPTRPSKPHAPGSRREAALIGLRAALAVAVMTAFWMASAWNMGFTAVSGGAVMLFFAVNQDNPLPVAKSFMLWASLGILAAYAVMVLVLPWLEGFEALALVLLLLLFPAGLMAGTPACAWAGIAFGGFLVSELGSGNSFNPNELAFVNAAVAMPLGMLACIAVLAVVPVTSQATRGRAWARIMGDVLPAAARGQYPGRTGAMVIIDMLAALLPRLALDRQHDEDFLRGTLGASSCAIELTRLDAVKHDPATPPEAAAAVDAFLSDFAATVEPLARAGHVTGARREAMLAQVEATVTRARAALATVPLEPATPQARAVLRAGASLRFIADRFDIDRPFLTRRFAED